MRKGSRSNQINGYAIRARRANGQQITNRMHHSRNVNMSETSAL
jgi:hypothetical protein